MQRKRIILNNYSIIFFSESKSACGRPKMVIARMVQRAPAGVEGNGSGRSTILEKCHFLNALGAVASPD